MSKLLFSFGIMSDCQYADADDIDLQVHGTDDFISNHYRQSPGKLQEAVDEFNRHDLEFIVHLGDFIDRDLDEADTVFDITRQTNTPVWQVLGNHDFLHSEGRLADILSLYGLESKYYAKEIGGYRFIILDTNDLGMIEYPEGSVEWQEGKAVVESLKKAGALNAYPWNGGIGDEQMNWLRQQLTEAQMAGQKIVLFAHHPVFPPNVHDALNRTEILALIDEFENVTAYINGHNHLGNYGERQGVPYLTVNGILQGDDNAFGIASVFDDRIEVKGFGRLPSHTWLL